MTTSHRRDGPQNRSTVLLMGWFIFAAVAVACLFIGAVAMKRSRDYGNSEDDDFDFDAYEGFDKK